MRIIFPYSHKFDSIMKTSVQAPKDLTGVWKNIYKSIQAKTEGFKVCIKCLGKRSCTIYHKSIEARKTIKEDAKYFLGRIWPFLCFVLQHGVSIINEDLLYFLAKEDN